MKEVKLNDHVLWEGEWGLRENTGKLIRLASNVARIREHISMERLTVCKTSEGQSVKTQILTMIQDTGKLRNTFRQSGHVIGFFFL